MIDSQVSTDTTMMALALKLAAGQSGKTGTNPSVGCVIVLDGCIVGQGATAGGGRPHAEAVALGQAGDKAAGATVYVTLEPCAHKSLRGPDCAGALVKAGIVRLVGCLVDPDPRTSGRGFEKLRCANIKVEVGLMAPEGEKQISSFALQFQ